MGKNWTWSFHKGREKRLAMELVASKGESVDRGIPLHSHDATMQRYFERGWHSVSHSQIYQHSMSKPLTPASPLEQIRRLKQCHFQPSQH